MARAEALPFRKPKRISKALRNVVAGFAAGSLLTGLGTHAVDSARYHSQLSRARTSYSQAYSKLESEHAKAMDNAGRKSSAELKRELARQQDDFKGRLLGNLFYGHKNPEKIYPLVDHQELFGDDVDRAFAVKRALDLAKAKGVSQALSHFSTKAKETAAKGGAESDYMYYSGIASMLRDLHNSPKKMNELGLQKEIKPPMGNASKK